MNKSIKFLREVLARRAAVVAVVTFVLQQLVANDIIAPDMSAKVTNLISGGFVLVGLLATVLVVRPAVTPVIDPRDKDGNHLVPELPPEQVVAVHDTTLQDDTQDPNQKLL